MYNPNIALFGLDKYVAVKPPKIKIGITKTFETGISGKINAKKPTRKIPNIIALTG